MRPVDDQTMNRIERASNLRTLQIYEKKAAELRSSLGLLTRENYVSVNGADVPIDGISRLRTDQLDRLRDRGALSQDAAAAALKFRTIFEAISRGMFSSPQGGMVGTQSRGRYRHPLERMTTREFCIWINEYKPWATKVGAQTAFTIEHPSGNHFSRTYLQVAYAVIIDNYGPSQLEREWPIPKAKGIITTALSEGLSKWEHRDYDETQTFDHVRATLIAESRERVEKNRPIKRK